MKRIIRQVGKYVIEVSSEEITEDNFFKHSVYIKYADNTFNFINADDLNLYMAKTFRYSEKEEEICRALELYIEILKFRIARMKEIL